MTQNDTGYKIPSFHPDPGPVQKREIFGWAMYDFANSSYTTVVISLLYGAFFTSTIVPPGNEMRDTYWAVAMILSALFTIILSPMIGAMCDASGAKKRALFISTIVCATSTVSLFLVNPGDILLGLFLITLSNTAFMIGESLCASFLTDLANTKNIGLISGIGWALGYFGGLASLVITQLIIITQPDTDPLAYILENQFAMVAIGLFYFIAALPTFLLVKKRSFPKPDFAKVSLFNLIKQGLTEFKNSVTVVKNYPTLFAFFGAFTIYMAGLEVIIKFIGIYTQEELHLPFADLVTIFIIIQLTAALGAITFGFLELAIGSKYTVLATIAWWIVAILAIYEIETLSEILAVNVRYVLFGIAAMAGTGLGSIQSSSRALVGLLSPP